MLNSHTHCQVAPADPQDKTCQRVCLPQPEKNFKIFLPLFKEKRVVSQKVCNVCFRLNKDIPFFFFLFFLPDELAGVGLWEFVFYDGFADKQIFFAVVEALA